MSFTCANAGGTEQDSSTKPKSGLFSLPFMTRAAEKQRLSAQQEAAAVLAQLEAEDEQAEIGSDDHDEEVGEVNGWQPGQGNAGRLSFGGSESAPQHQVQTSNHNVLLVQRLHLFQNTKMALHQISITQKYCYSQSAAIDTELCCACNRVSLCKGPCIRTFCLYEIADVHIMLCVTTC